MEIIKINTISPVIKFNYTNEEHLIHFENEIKLNVGPLSYKTNVKGQMTSYTHFLKNNRFNIFLNFFANKIFETLKNNDPLNLKNFSSLKVVNAWGNKLNPGEIVNPHSHIGGIDYSSVIYFSKTYLVLEGQKIYTQRGDILTFFCTSKHWTDKAEIERLSLAFNWLNTTPNIKI